MAATQSAKNHTRFDPAWHFVLVPVLLVNLILSVYWSIHDPHGQHGQWIHAAWRIVVSIALLLLAAIMRGYALKLQNRLIWLEERVRLGRALSAAELDALSGKQLIALRFASDAEAPALARRALAERLDAPQIKAAIATWRPDNNRV